MISAIVLAAGKSSRMGSENKMLLPFNASTVLGTVINELAPSLADEIIVVVNENSDISARLVTDNLMQVVINMDADNGLTSSIQCGIKAADNASDGYLICLGDMPLLTFIDYNLLINKLLDHNNKAIIIPLFDGQRGNPVLFSAHFKEEILVLQDDNGCKPVVVANNDFVIEVPCSNNHCHVDIDTLEDYKKLTG